MARVLWRRAIAMAYSATTVLPRVRSCTEGDIKRVVSMIWEIQAIFYQGQDIHTSIEGNNNIKRYCDSDIKEGGARFCVLKCERPRRHTLGVDIII